VEQDLEYVEKMQKKLEEKAQKFSTVINSDYGMLDDLVKDMGKQRKALREIQTSDPAALNRVRTVRASLEKIHRAATPETGSLFVRLWLGQVNVKQYRDQDRNVLKLEYEKFKDRTNYLFFAFVTLQLLFKRVLFLEVIFHIWLLYYYTSLALRENILKVNGSNIKPWWIIHHYLSIITSLAALMLPVAIYHELVDVFLYFGVFQGVVQMLMNRYQSAQLYRHIALGRADRMDVVGDGQLSWAPSAWVLLPFLLIFQLSQLVLAYLLWVLMNKVGFDWHLVLLGAVFVMLGVGNITTTLLTYVEKFKRPVAGAKKSPSAGPAAVLADTAAPAKKLA
jgi:hypothetical protein